MFSNNRITLTTAPVLRCGQKVFQEEQQSAILNGLLPEYDHVVSIITTSQTPFDLQGIVTTLLDAEAHQNAHLT
ncbi:hypothetical protein J1N35_022003 [Gossypium stocksii]|uniref:Uncharacterized protein n=1 Tax=Gossypium stocksii TaxID=47602 RepID=A0A9D3VHC6_9ROSI|nr:hypothetical protein J1N35_022003 [Gossypium stocksii]